MRVCPTVEGSATPLNVHRIGVDECLQRQHCNYHKCHRCVYRGQTANWTPPDHANGDETAMTTGARGAPSRNGVARTRTKAVELPSAPPPSVPQAKSPKTPKLPKAQKKVAPQKPAPLPARTPTPPTTNPA
jgi:hypothetical protein